MANYAVFAVILILLAVVATACLLYFGNRKTFSWYVQVTCFIAWFFPFTIVFILPLDLSSTRYDKCLRLLDESRGSNSTGQPTLLCEEPLGYVEHDFLWGFWDTVYWTSFNLTWFVIPLMLGYVRSGEFSFGRKVWDSIKGNLSFYAILGGVGSIFLIYALAVTRIPKDQLMGIMIAAANSWGLFLCTFMLGYGLVKVPRVIWQTSSTDWHLKYIESQAPKMKETSIDSEAEVYEVARHIAVSSKRIPTEEVELKAIAEKLLEKCPLALQERSSNDDGEDVSRVITKKGLVALHARINRALKGQERDKARLQFLLQRAFFFQDVIQHYQSPERKLKSQFLPVSDGPYKEYILQAYWWWYVWIRPVLLKSLSVILVIASVIVVWSESTFQIAAVDLSIPKLVIDTVKSYFLLEIVSMAFLIYMCSCTYSTLFRVKILDYYQMVPEHHTDEATLLFVGGYLCRLTFPLCYNYLTMAGLAEGSDLTDLPVFIQYLGPAVKLTPLFGDNYNDWLPYIILVIAVIVTFHLHHRILTFLRIKNYSFLVEEHPDLEEGHRIIQQARAMEEKRILRGGGPQDVGSSLDYGETGLSRATQSSLSKGRTAAGGNLTAQLLAKYNRGDGASVASDEERGHRPSTLASAGSSAGPSKVAPQSSNASSLRSLFGQKPTVPPSVNDLESGSGTGPKRVFGRT